MKHARFTARLTARLPASALLLAVSATSTAPAPRRLLRTCFVPKKTELMRDFPVDAGSRLGRMNGTRSSRGIREDPLARKPRSLSQDFGPGDRVAECAWWPGEVPAGRSGNRPRNTDQGGCKGLIRSEQGEAGTALSALPAFQTLRLQDEFHSVATQGGVVPTGKVEGDSDTRAAGALTSSLMRALTAIA